MADNGEWYDGLNGEYALSPQLANRRAMYCKSAATGTRVAIWWYEWTNTFAFSVWKGIGVGLTYGIRRADAEIQETQTRYNVGLSYTL